MPTKGDDGSLEFQFDRRFTDLEMRFAFQEQALISGLNPCCRTLSSLLTLGTSR